MILILRSATSYQNWQKMIPRRDKVEVGETMAPEATVAASAEADMVVVDVDTEVVVVATVTTVEETEVVVDTVEGEDMETTVVVEEEVVGVVMVDTVETPGVMTEVWAEAGEIQALVVAWMAAVVEANFTIHSPSAKECVATLAKLIQPLLLQLTWKNPTPMVEAVTSSHSNHSETVELPSTKLAIQATTTLTMRIRATTTTALFMLAI